MTPERLWCEVAIAVARAETSKRSETPIEWADHVVRAYRERFPGADPFRRQGEAVSTFAGNVEKKELEGT